MSNSCRGVIGSYRIEAILFPKCSFGNYFFIIPIKNIYGIIGISNNVK